MSEQQIVILIVGILLLGVVKVFVKKAIKLVLLVVLCITIVSGVGVYSPKHLDKTVSQVGVSSFKEIAKTSDKVKISGSDVFINVNGGWCNIKQIEGYVPSDKGSVDIMINNKKYNVTDDGVIKALKLLR